MACSLADDYSNVARTYTRCLVDWISSGIPHPLDHHWTRFAGCATIGTLDNKEDEQNT